MPFLYSSNASGQNCSVTWTGSILLQLNQPNGVYYAGGVYYPDDCIEEIILPDGILVDVPFSILPRPDGRPITVKVGVGKKISIIDINCVKTASLSANNVIFTALGNQMWSGIFSETARKQDFVNCTFEHAENAITFGEKSHRISFTGCNFLNNYVSIYNESGNSFYHNSLPIKNCNFEINQTLLPPHEADVKGKAGIFFKAWPTDTADGITVKVGFTAYLYPYIVNPSNKMKNLLNGILLRDHVVGLSGQCAFNVLPQGPTNTYNTNIQFADFDGYDCGRIITDPSDPPYVEGGMVVVRNFEPYINGLGYYRSYIFSGIHATNCTDGIQATALHSLNFIIVNCDFKDNIYNAISFNNPTFVTPKRRNILVKYCTFNDDNIQFNYTRSREEVNLISNNFFKPITGSIRLNFINDPTIPTNWSFSLQANTLDNRDNIQWIEGGKSRAYGILINDPAFNVVGNNLLDKIILSNNLYGFFRAIQLNNSRRKVSILGNHIEYQRINNIDKAWGIMLTGCQNVDLYQNGIFCTDNPSEPTMLETYGIEARNCNNTEVNCNTIATSRFGLRLTGNASSTQNIAIKTNFFVKNFYQVSSNVGYSNQTSQHFTNDNDFTPPTLANYAHQHHTGTNNPLDPKPGQFFFRNPRGTGIAPDPWNKIGLNIPQEQYITPINPYQACLPLQPRPYDSLGFDLAVQAALTIGNEQPNIASEQQWTEEIDAYAILDQNQIMRDTNVNYRLAYQQWRTTSPGRLFRANDLIEDNLNTQGLRVANRTNTTSYADSLYKAFLMYKADSLRQISLSSADSILLYTILTTCTQAIGSWQADAYNLWLKAGGAIMGFIDCEDTTTSSNNVAPNTKTVLNEVKWVQTPADITLVPNAHMPANVLWKAEWVDALGRKSTAFFEPGNAMQKPKTPGIYMLCLYANNNLYATYKIWVH